MKLMRAIVERENDFAQVEGMVPGGVVVGAGLEESSGREQIRLGASEPTTPIEEPSGPHETGFPCASLLRKKPNVIELFDGAPGARDEWRVGEGNRRLKILEAFWGLVGEGRGERGEGGKGMSRAKAARVVGVPYVTLWRWERGYKADGFNGLVPGTERCGRKSTFEKLGMSAEEVQGMVAEVKGIGVDTGSVTSSLRLYASSDRCRPDLAAVILDPNRSSKHALPPALRQAVKVSGPERLAHRGPRQLALGGIWTPRKLDILPGDIFTIDDTTPIWGWWVPWRECEEYPFGVKLLQGQLLPVMDVGSQAVISYVLIAREKGSYRAADIWHVFGHTFEQVGLPRLGFQLERGSFEANLIRGQEVVFEKDEVSGSRRVGGLRQLPTNVTGWHREKWGKSEQLSVKSDQAFPFPKTLETWTSFLPKSKSIEALFNRMQALEGTLWGNLGRDQMRAPMEKAKKILGACQRGSEDPRLHFLSQAELMSRLNGILGYLNNEPMEGEVFSGIPIQKFEAAVKEYPLFRLPEEEAWLYRRDWAVVKITRGWARVRLTQGVSGERYSLFYGNPEVFAKHEGDEVAVYFDREEFERPAQIILGRTGEFLCEAEYEERKGSFLSGDLTGHEVRKRWKDAVMSGYGTLVKHAPSRQVPEEIARRRRERGEGRGESGKGTEGTEPARDTATTDGALGQTRPTSTDGALGETRATTAKVVQPGGSADAADAFARQRNRLAVLAGLANRAGDLRQRGLD